MAEKQPVEKCPNCGADLKSGLISSNQLLPENKVALINDYKEGDRPAYCNKCGGPLVKKAIEKAGHELFSLSAYFQDNIQHVPLASIHAPLNWQYSVLGIVTGQSTLGTGLFTDFVSDFTDFSGEQSGTYNKKLAAGEQYCFAQLRMKALSLGGNAVIGVDIDYGEVGGGKGMLMVATTGTAVLLQNAEVLPKETVPHLKELWAKSQRRNRILWMKS